MKIFETKEGEPVARALKMVLPIFGIGEKTPLILANIEGFFEKSGRRRGVEDILGEIEADAERPIIFYSFDNKEFFEMIGHPASRLFYRTDIGFIKAPFELTKLKELYDLLVSGKKIANPAMEAFLSVGVKRSLVNILLHDICHEPLVPKVLEKSKNEFGFVGSKEEVINRLEAIKEGDQADELAEKWKDKIFPGIFCDIEGTLFINEKVNDNVLKMLKKFAEVKPVTLWTGGDLWEIKKKLLANWIVYPLVSKYSFKGCGAEIVIDDLSQGEFREKYDIISREYVQIKK